MSASDARSTPHWLLVTVPAACLAASYLIYSKRRTFLAWAYDVVAKTSPHKGSGKRFLAGNFAPVEDELFNQNLELVDGKLPEGLEGCYVRTGPNPFYEPVAGYHWFDGDGMLHVVRLQEGQAAYCNRFVDTEKLRQERAAGRPLFPRMGDFIGFRGVVLSLLHEFAKAVGAVRGDKGAGVANTALVYHAGRLLSLHEGDLPYGVRILCNGLVETLGRLRMDSSWKTSFTAHPKKDPVNDELLFIGYGITKQPYVSAGIMDSYGNMVRQWGVQLPNPIMMHDMAATEHYIVLLDFPLCFDPKVMVEEKTVPFKLRKELPSRIGLLRRDLPSCPNGNAEVQWFELPGPGFMAFHVANAFEDANGDVKVYACQMNDLSLDLAKMNVEELARMTEYTLSPSTGTAWARRISEATGDFPVVHPSKVTRPCRWSWMAVFDSAPSMPSFTGIAKMDLAAAPGTDACVGRIQYPQGTYGGEAVFVPRNPDATTAADEDDGYLVVYVYDTTLDASYMNVYDARTMSSKPLASLRMPRRVPYGFHGTWVTEQQLKKQITWI